MCPNFQIKRETIQTSVATKMHDKIECVCESMHHGRVGCATCLYVHVVMVPLL